MQNPGEDNGHGVVGVSRLPCVVAVWWWWLGGGGLVVVAWWWSRVSCVKSVIKNFGVRKIRIIDININIYLL